MIMNAEMMKTNSCPRCHSEDVEIVDYGGAKMVSCNECGYNEEEAFTDFPQEKTSQKAKGAYAKYRTGGGRRAVKLK